MVEQRSPKPRAEGSSPSAPAKPLNAVFAAMAQSVERVLGKDEVGSSNLPSSSSGTSAGIQGTGAVAPVFCYAPGAGFPASRRNFSRPAIKITFLDTNILGRFAVISIAYVIIGRKV